MSVKVLLNEENDAIVKVEIANFPAQFIRFHVYEGQFYMKNVGMSLPFRLLQKVGEMK